MRFEIACNGEMTNHFQFVVYIFTMLLFTRAAVTLLGEVIPTLFRANELGIHRPAYSFGIQKIFRHAFTLVFSTSPGVTTSQRAGTRATFLGDPGSERPQGLFLGFDLTRRVH